MKEIKAIIQPHRLNNVLGALSHIINLPAVTVADVRGIDPHQGAMAQVTKTKLELMVSDEMAPAVIAAIQAHAHTGKVGDGRIFVIHVEESILIRTGQRENGAPPAPDFHPNQDLQS